MSELQELKATAVKLQQQIEALEKPKQWKPRDGDYTSTHCTMRDTIAAFTKARCAMNTYNRLLAYVDEFGGDWEADWSDSTQEKGYVYYNYSSHRWSAESWVSRCCVGTVYMSEECAKDLAAKLNSGEVVL